MPVSSYVYILALKLWIRVLHLEYPQKLEIGLMRFCCLTKSMPTLFHCQQARPYPGVSVGGTPLALPNSPPPPSENALPSLLPHLLALGRARELPLPLDLFFPLLALIRTTAGCHQLRGTPYSGAQDLSPCCPVFSRLRAA